jgi:lipopolysaccharide/colanic/teichoic acid biosynthesis glycosyltransferase
MNQLSTWLKRPFDVIGAIGGLIVFAPVMAAIAAAILLADGRPLLFRQTRLGRGRRPFTILKFRTMRDENVTAIGRLLRATGLDELPQLVNVFRGELSAVGPRPLMEADVRRLGWTDPACDFRWSVRPGLTGLAQVVGTRSARHALRLDRCYIARQSLRLDVRLIAWSFAINVVGKARVRRLISRRPDRVPSTSATSSRRGGPARPTIDPACPYPGA